ncbi:hypothetical protein [Paucibacter sp. M5-1]|nr:hypothetical protein [Paucibacter sp. M5-1]MCZ7882409.1 hypothetical protein [Paucibacter sp. M5-1]
MIDSSFSACGWIGFEALEPAILVVGIAVSMDRTLNLGPLKKNRQRRN